MAEVCIHSSLSSNVTIQGYARELSNYLNGVSLSGRLGKNGGFERNFAATSSGVLKIHIKVPNESFWKATEKQSGRTSNNFLVYVRHWDYVEKFQILAVITPDAHERVDAMLPAIIKIAERDFHALTDVELSHLVYY